ncbi:MAG TPA: hemerythrin domain-containing protein [Egibacteraceae bacterium]|nr:hemerythrin domain-containing protein [Pseudonocardia sp.]HWH32354.1 hemerythrin domain-containing protein [Egibacteraceae bacterium]
MSDVGGNYVQMNELVHAGLRRDLDRIGQVARQPLTAERREALARRVSWLVEFLHHHHASEEEAIWPLAVRKRPQLGGLMEAMEAEHGALAAAADGLHEAAAAYAGDGSESKRQALVAALDRMRITCLPHLEHEEAAAVPQLVQTLDDREWAKVDKRFRRGLGPKDLGWIAMWLLDDLDPAHARFLRGQLPRPVLTLLTWRWGRPYAREASLAWGELAGVRG